MLPSMEGICSHSVWEGGGWVAITFWLIETRKRFSSYNGSMSMDAGREEFGGMLAAENILVLYHTMLEWRVL